MKTFLIFATIALLIVVSVAGDDDASRSVRAKGKLRALSHPERRAAVARPMRLVQQSLHHLKRASRAKKVAKRFAAQIRNGRKTPVTVRKMKRAMAVQKRNIMMAERKLKKALVQRRRMRAGHKRSGAKRLMRGRK